LRAVDFDAAIRFNEPMRKLIPAVLLALVPLTFHSAAAQTQLTPKPAKSAAARSDNCAPIGRTANGELVYSMKCENLPAPVAPPPQARMEETAPPPPPPQQESRGGLFGWSYDRRQPE
jgi:hypothetical protein